MFLEDQITKYKALHIVFDVLARISKFINVSTLFLFLLFKLGISLWWCLLIFIVGWLLTRMLYVACWNRSMIFKKVYELYQEEKDKNI